MGDETSKNNFIPYPTIHSLSGSISRSLPPPLWRVTRVPSFSKIQTCPEDVEDSCHQLPARTFVERCPAEHMFFGLVQIKIKAVSSFQLVQSFVRPHTIMVSLSCATTISSPCYGNKAESPQPLPPFTSFDSKVLPGFFTLQPWFVSFE